MIIPGPARMSGPGEHLYRLAGDADTVARAWRIRNAIPTHEGEPVSDLPTGADVRAATGALHRLYETLTEARRVQYEAPPNLHSDREPGEPANPTADIALDPRRMKLRLAVIRAERTLRSAAPAVDARTAELEAALDAWAGHSKEGA